MICMRKIKERKTKIVSEVLEYDSMIETVSNVWTYIFSEYKSRMRSAKIKHNNGVHHFNRFSSRVNLRTEFHFKFEVLRKYQVLPTFEQMIAVFQEDSRKHLHSMYRDN